MASVYRNGNLFWIKFRNPHGKDFLRYSLETPDACRAQLLQKKIELELELLRPEILGIEMPEEIQKVLPATYGTVTETPQPKKGIRMPIGEIIRSYIEWCKIENDYHHARNKESKLRLLFGRALVEGTGPADGPLAVKCLEDLGKDQVQECINGLEIKDSTKRHYREVIHSLFEYALKNSLLQATNLHTPNPMSALPSWSGSVSVIEFLNEEDIRKQLEAVKHDPMLHMAVALYIYTGMRREEALWLERESVAKDIQENKLCLKYVYDEKTKKIKDFKTGHRPMTLLPELKPILAAYLPTVTGRWLLPTPTGLKWDKDHFSALLREANKKAGLKWSCMHFRHTFATRMASQKWTVFRLAREMGTSVQMITKHYAAWFPPDALG